MTSCLVPWATKRLKESQVATSGYTLFAISFGTEVFQLNRKLNYLRMNYSFEKITFSLERFQADLTFNLRGAWHTLYATLLSNYK